MNPYPRPTFQDWLMLAIGLLFVLIGLFRLPQEPSVAIPCLAFSGIVSFLSVSTIARKRRFSRFSSVGVEVVGGVPIRPSKGYFLLLAFTFTGLGLIFLIFMPRPLAMAVIAAITTLTGIVLLAGVLSGRLPGGFLRFDPEGLSFGTRKGLYQFPWDRIVAVWPGDVKDNPTLFLRLRSPDDAVAFPPLSPRKLRARLESSARWQGAHAVIMTSQYRIDLPVLAAAVERYVTSPEARDELARRAFPSSHPHGSEGTKGS